MNPVKYRIRASFIKTERRFSFGILKNVFVNTLKEYLNIHITLLDGAAFSLVILLI